MTLHSCIKGRASRELLSGQQHSDRKVLERKIRAYKSLGIKKERRPTYISPSKWKPMYTIVPKRYKK